ncbi:MAG TPA: hypothetical protein VNJ01_01430 [Bacteriovoracaceae bacterium]|nr:hypothetical protein [Bacteriovoracaceae bacterium]
MKYIALAVLVVFSQQGLAAPRTVSKAPAAKMAIGSKHQVSFGNTFSTAASGSRTSLGLNKDSDAISYLLGDADLSLNYAYKVLPRFQVGGIAGYSNDSEDIKYRDGSTLTEASTDIRIYLFVTFNFSQALSSSYYVTGLLGKELSDSESKDSALGTTKTDSDKTGAGLIFGKRFSLRSLGIVNLTYSPSISFKREIAGGDLKKEGTDNLDSITLDLIKFDLLF